jgi:predicted protein tyrosine phosphatase
MSKLYRVLLIAGLWFFSIGAGMDYRIGIKTMHIPGAPLLVTDAKSDQILPNKFRIIPGYHGIGGMVGSAQFNQNGLEAMLAEIKKHHSQNNKIKIWLVDLRQETHFFANGQALSFYGSHNSANFHKSPEQIYQEESKMISDFQKKSDPTTVNIVLEKANGEIAKTQPLLMNLQASQSEESLAIQHGLNYKRFYITDHQAPTPENTQKLVQFINQLDAQDWVIVHCRGGKGRTTTFMLLTALLKDKEKIKHHPEARLNTIESYIQEQIDLGGSNLFKFDDADDPIWRIEHKKDRAKFIQEFYQKLN